MLAVVPTMVFYAGGQDKPLFESVLQAISEGSTPKLEELRISLRGINLPWDAALDIDAGLLSRAVVKVETCVIVGGHSRQQEAIFTAISQSQDLVLKRLDASHVGAGSPVVIAAAALKLEGLSLDWSTAAQVEEVLTRLGNTEGSKLRELWFGGSASRWFGEEFDISHLSPEVLVRALLNIDLDEFGLDNFKFSSEQLNLLLSKIRDSDLKLTHLRLDGDNNLSQVPPQLMASAFSRLESVDLGYHNEVSVEQFSAIFMMLASQELGGSKLRSLTIQDIMALQSISPEVLVDAIRRLNKFEVQWSIVTAEQINAILTAVTERREGMLKNIKILISKDDIVGGTVSQSLLQSAKQVNDILEIEFESD